MPFTAQGKNVLGAFTSDASAKAARERLPLVFEIDGNEGAAFGDESAVGTGREGGKAKCLNFRDHPWATCEGNGVSGAFGGAGDRDERVEVSAVAGECE